ncbi:MAG: hypothetical protein K9N49_10675 [Candidatus Marinimicrobia bacterium]|nr:hypothetical protein [Candidatus Neomarinimicrobiota bacterium]
MTWHTIRFWLAICLLLDAAFGLWGFASLQTVIPPNRLRRIALAEAALGLILLAFHYL